MAKPEFGEYQYVHGTMHELENLRPKRIVGTPYFPTQREEVHIGADVVIEIQQGNVRLGPLFMQFKRSDRLTQPNAKQWHIFNKPYYRFGIRSKEQHSILVQHCSGLGTAVYVAPGFHTVAEYCYLHQNQQLAKESVCFDCTEMDTVTHDDHCVAYRCEPLEGKFCSEREELQPNIGITERIYEMRQNELNFMSYSSLQNQFYEINDVLRQRLDIEDIYETHQSDPNPASWIRAQQQFFFEVFGIILLFILEEGSIAHPTPSSTILDFANLD